MPREDSYYDVLTAAINDVAEHGYDSPTRIAYWTEKLRRAAEKLMKPPAEMERMLRDTLATTYKRLVDSGQIAQFHQGVQRFTIEKLRPQLRAELDRRIVASADLIRLNKREAVEKTLHRFQGWSTSIPKGGSDNVQRQKTKDDIRKSMRSLPFEERRVLIDQGFKLRSSLSDILANDGGAIAVVWNSHWQQAGYDYREKHKDRAGHVYAIRGAWAFDKGLAKVGASGYYDEVTAFAQEPFCRCWGSYLYTLRDLERHAPDMLTNKGRAALAEARQKIKDMH